MQFEEAIVAQLSTMVPDNLANDRKYPETPRHA